MAIQSRQSRRLTEAERSEILRRVRTGESSLSIAQAVGRPRRLVNLVLERTGGFVPRPRTRAPLRLSLAEREEISRGLESGSSCRAIAWRLGRASSTISREVCRARGTGEYRAWAADLAALHLARRPKRPKLLRLPRLRAVVERLLALRWSPEQISHGLVREYPDQEEMRVSHETIYRSLYVQAKGSLRKELTGYLRTGRTRRQPRRRTRVPGHPRHGADQRAPGRAQRPRRARSLVGRPAPRDAPALRPSAPWSSGAPATRCCCVSPMDGPRPRCDARSPGASAR